jgi:gliding motility-associated-like protein
MTNQPILTFLTRFCVIAIVAAANVLPATSQVLEADSLVLVNLYNSNGGSTWTNSTNWLATDVDTWFGVSVADNRVTEIRLNNNTVVGDLSNGLATLDSLQVLSVTGNELTAVPNLSGLTSLDTLQVGSNKLTFADVIPNISAGLDSYVYAPQDSIDDPVNLSALLGSSLVAVVTEEAGLGNEYQWRKDGLNITGETNDTLQLNCITPASSNGSYTCRVTNSLAPQLTLARRNVELTVIDFTVDAGPDESICLNGIQLSASIPPIGFGTWALVTGSGVFTNAIDPFTTVTDLGVGANTFRWNISNGSCMNVAFADVIIVRSEPPLPAVAGLDKFNCSPSDSLTATTPSIGAGVWTVIQGNGVLADSLNPNTHVGGLSVGENIFRWKVTNGACQSVFDEMKIIRQEPYTSATVSSDTAICGLEADLSSEYPVDGSSWWEVAEGTGNIDNIYSTSPYVTELSEGPNVFRWYNDNACAQPIYAEQTVTVFNFIYADAGTDTSILYNSFDPFPIGGDSAASGGDGNYIYFWENSAPIDDFEAANPQVSFPDTGMYEFSLIVEDGNNCVAYDTVNVHVELSDVLTVPSLFTPNDDGNNDTFVIPGVKGHPNSKLEILNRQGSLVYKTEGYRNDWDGVANQGLFLGSDKLPEDTYYYVLDLNKGKEPQTGYVVIKR